MTPNKTEAQPEALALADRLIGNAEIDESEGCNPLVIALERAAADELRRQHAEIQQLKAQLNDRGDYFYGFGSSLQVFGSHQSIKALKAQLSARQAAPEGWMQGARYALESVAYVGSECWTNDGMRAVCIKKAADRIVAEHDRLLAAPPPPEREPQKGETND